MDLAERDAFYKHCNCVHVSDRYLDIEILIRMHIYIYLYLYLYILT